VRLGSHLSVAGGVANAVREAVSLGLDAVQVFTANQRQWSPRPPSDEQVKEWFVALRDAGWGDADDIRVVSHNSYLVNLASPDPTARARSLALQRAELERCEALAIRRCVMHPGAHLGAPAPRVAAPSRTEPCTDDELAGLERLASSLDELHAQTAGFKVLTCLENTAGAGTALGYDLRHLAIVRDMMKTPERIGFCFDTCHATVAGYDMHTDAGAKETVDRLFDTLEIDRTPVRNERDPKRANGAKRRFAPLCLVFHLNDSKGVLASRLDRHEHIGDGACGSPCFQALLGEPAFDRCPGILETPKEGDYKGTPWDVENVRRLRALGDVASGVDAAARQQSVKARATKASPKRSKSAVPRTRDRSRR